MNPIKWHELKGGNEYIISHNINIHDKTIYKGIFIERQETRGVRRILNERGYEMYEKVISWYSLFSINGHKKYFFESDTYYDLKQITDNAKRAKENMELRALNKILKCIVNEEFQWY